MAVCSGTQISITSSTSMSGADCPRLSRSWISSTCALRSSAFAAASLRMVERYAHVTDEELYRAVKLAGLHAAGTNAGTAVQSDLDESVGASA